LLVVVVAESQAAVQEDIVLVHYLLIQKTLQ
jgi:hypothetical protein